MNYILSQENIFIAVKMGSSDLFGLLVWKVLVSKFM